MTEKQKTYWQNILIIACLLSLILIWLGFGDQGLLHLYRKYMEKQAYIERINQLTKENMALQEEIRRLRTDREYVEELVRKELNLVKKNEIIYRFTDKKAKKGPDNRSIHKKKSDSPHR